MVTLLCTSVSMAKNVDDVDKFVRELIAKMTVEEKAGQMIQPDKRTVTPSEVTKYFIGSVLSGGGAAPASGNTPKDWADMYDEYQRAALNTRLGIPIVYGQDGVHGVNNVYVKDKQSTHTSTPSVLCSFVATFFKTQTKTLCYLFGIDFF